MDQRTDNNKEMTADVVCHRRQTQSQMNDVVRGVQNKTNRKRNKESAKYGYGDMTAATGM